MNDVDIKKAEIVKPEIIKMDLYSKTPVVILTLKEYNDLLNKSKENTKLKQIIAALKDLKGTIDAAGNICNDIITEM